MFSTKVMSLFIVSMMMAATGVVAGPAPVAAEINATTISAVATKTAVQASTPTQVQSVEPAPKDSIMVAHATSVATRMGPAITMVALVSTMFAPKEHSRDALATDHWESVEEGLRKNRDLSFFNLQPATYMVLSTLSTEEWKSTPAPPRRKEKSQISWKRRKQDHAKDFYKYGIGVNRQLAVSRKTIRV
ncbi:hypothetical protein L218DRAFT_943841 [Marasmius fiardii PR-910]|nr:hypothetical protein L218DRAFT_943841 [Marasmius fiardii PR-910]